MKQFDRPEPLALVVGDVITDILVRPDGSLRRGTDRAAVIRVLPGGAGANQAAWLARFGVGARLAARVGAADLPAIAARLRRLGVEPALTADPGLATGTIVTLLDPDGERSFLTDRGANAKLACADLPARLLDGAALLHLSGYALFAPGPRQAVLALAAAARGRGIPVTVDAASSGFLAEVGAAAFLAWTRGAAICFANADEAALLAGADEPARQRAALLASYDRVVIKRGAAGAELAARNGRVWTQPAPDVAAVDATGAGDALLGAFLAAWLAGAPPEACLAAGVAAGAAAVTVPGGQPPDDATQAVPAGWPASAEGDEA